MQTAFAEVSDFPLSDRMGAKNCFLAGFFEVANCNSDNLCYVRNFEDYYYKKGKTAALKLINGASHEFF